MIVSKSNILHLNKPHSLTDYAEIGQFQSLIFVKPGFSFTNETDLLTETTWLTALENKNVYIAHMVKEVEPVDEEALYGLSRSDFEYKISEGKTRYNIRFNYGITTHNRLKSFEEQDLKVMFFDGTNIIAKQNDDNTFEGFETSFIHVKKKQIGQTSTPQWSEVHIEINDTEWQSDSTFKEVDFEFNELSFMTLELSDASSRPANVISIVIKDDVYGCVVPFYDISAVTIADNVSSLVITGYEYKNGRLYITVDDIIYDGIISISSDEYVSNSLAYDFRKRALDITLNNTSSNELSFNVKEFSTQFNILILQSSEITINDDVNGVINVVGFVNNGLGDYSINGDAQFKSGTITIDSVNYNGSVTYNVITGTIFNPGEFNNGEFKTS